MNAKANPFRFTLQFNESDARHQRAVEILNRQGKSKSQYIVTALLHYVDCSREPVEQTDFPDLNLVADRIIRETSERVLAGLPKQAAAEKNLVNPIPSVPTPPKEAAGAAQMDADRELLQGSMGLFRSRK